MFNLFNRSNFTAVNNVFGTGSYPSSPSPTFGQFTQAAPPRQVQLALKIGFRFSVLGFWVPVLLGAGS